MGYQESSSLFSQSRTRESDSALNPQLSFEQSLFRNLMEMDEPQNFDSTNRNTQEYLNQQQQTYNTAPNQEMMSEEEESLHTEELHKIPLKYNEPNMCFTFEESIRIAALLQVCQLTYGKISHRSFCHL